MKNLKLLLFCLLCGVLVLAGCEKTNSNENLSCEKDDTCPIEDINNEIPTLVIEDTPTIVINDENVEGDLNGNGEGFREETDNNEETSDQPMMRKMVVDENATPEEIENDMIETCKNLGGSWLDGKCTLEDGSEIVF